MSSSKKVPPASKNKAAPSDVNDVDALTVSIDTLSFRATRTGRVISSWEEISAANFSIPAAVAAAAANPGYEDLGQPDTGPVGRLPCPASPTTAPAPECPLTRAQRSKARSKAKKAACRAVVKATRDPFTDPCPSRHQRHITNAVPIKAKFQLHRVRVASTGWIGLHDFGMILGEETPARYVHELSDFFGPKATRKGFTLVKSQGPKSRPITDADGQVCAVYGGMPSDPNFMRDVHDPAVAAMEKAHSEVSVSEAAMSHRRGTFVGLSGGGSHGTGRLRPGNIVNGVINAAVFASLISNNAFIRFAGFASFLFANWAPNLYDFYADYMGPFYIKYPHIKRPFANSIWSACTFNLGPRTCALGHRDHANLAFGWCAITALGNFDYRKGGHLILWDCKLILEFPPATTVLILSATIFHSNIGIGPGECRYSFTQYTAGALFRWVERGFMSEEEFFSTLSSEEAKAERALGVQRAAEGAAMFSTVEELAAGV